MPQTLLTLSAELSRATQALLIGQHAYNEALTHYLRASEAVIRYLGESLAKEKEAHDAPNA